MGPEEYGKAAFEAADIDKNGQLDVEEMRELGTALGVTDPTKMQMAIAEMDADGDNFITHKEFMSWWRKNLLLEQRKEESALDTKAWKTLTHESNRGKAAKTSGEPWTRHPSDEALLIQNCIWYILD